MKLKKKPKFTGQATSTHKRGSQEIDCRDTVIVPMMPKVCNMEIIMPRAQVVVKRVEAFVVTGEFKK